MNLNDIPKVVTLCELNKKYEEEFGIEYPFDDPNSFHNRVKYFYSSQIRALLEGLKMEKLPIRDKNIEIIVVDETNWQIVGFNEAVDLLNEKIDKILK